MVNTTLVSGIMRVQIEVIGRSVDGQKCEGAVSGPEYYHAVNCSAAMIILVEYFRLLLHERQFFWRKIVQRIWIHISQPESTLNYHIETEFCRNIKAQATSCKWNFAKVRVFGEISQVNGPFKRRELYSLQIWKFLQSSTCGVKRLVTLLIKGINIGTTLKQS